MNCEKFLESWTDFQVRGAQAPRDLEAHRASCAACAREARGLDAAWESLDALAPVATPAALRERLCSQISGLLGEEAQAGGLSLRHLLLALASGAALALLGLWSLSPQVNLGAIAPGRVTACAAWWTGLFALSSALILGRFRYGTLNLSLASGMSAAAAGLILASAVFCSKFTLLSLWLSSAPGGLLTSSLGQGAGYLSFGLLYAAAPTVLVSLWLGRGLGPSWPRHGLAAGLGFSLLMLPSLYLQCCHLPLGLAFLLGLGVALGGLSGALGGLALGRLRPVAA